MDVEGSYPEKENEIMVSRAVLERMGIDDPSIGMAMSRDVSSCYEQNALIALKQMIEDNPAISLTSRIEAMAELVVLKWQS